MHQNGFGNIIMSGPIWGLATLPQTKNEFGRISSTFETY